LILDASVCTYDRLFIILKKASLYGVDIVQLRDKLGTSKEILAFTKKALLLLRGRIPFILNDRVDLALISGADGVHLGQDDVLLSAARKMLGSRAIIGVSCQRLEQVRQAYHEGADYIGFGSVFKTLTKPERSPMNEGLLVKAAAYAWRVEIPLFAIGGITGGNLGLLLQKGVRRIAVCRDILTAKDTIHSVKRIRRILDSNF